MIPDMAYPNLLALHNALRWIVLVAAIVAFAVAVSGWSGTKPVTPLLKRCGSLFVAAMDVQFLIGLILYFGVSPLIKMAFENMSVTMKDHELRFFTVEHTTYMLLAVILAHVGAIRSRKAKTDRAKYRGAAVFYGLSLLLILAGIPWWRPLLRLGS
ncbi:MAG TPA: hypothetical protein VGM62_12800 [Chthoniobacterales bacterium]|jgi:hypothetical protein